MVGMKVEKLVAGQKVSVPLIDFKDLADPAKHASVIAEVARACETVGFFEIINSGIPREILGEAFDTSRDFFNLPDGEKRELAPDLKEKTPMVPVFQLGYKGHPILRGVLNRMEELVFRNYHMREGE
jgi:isopenicillin N synthase-like dioxygenase